MSDSNVFNLPIYGKPIELDDAGIYYTTNKKTGAINNVFHLVYENDLNQDGEWYLYQLKNTSKNGEMGWVILADNGDYPGSDAPHPDAVLYRRTGRDALFQ